MRFTWDEDLKILLKMHVQNFCKSRTWNTKKSFKPPKLLAPIHCLRSERKTNLTRYPYTARESTFDWQIKQTRNSLIRSTLNLTARILNKSARSDVRALPRVQKWPSLDAYTTTSNHVIELCPGIVQDTI